MTIRTFFLGPNYSLYLMDRSMFCVTQGRNSLLLEGLSVSLFPADIVLNEPGDFSSLLVEL